ncbi:PD-(D/E)XK nuclease superfamily [Bifidobacterium hapali]|uniref:PD-(D/E)XK nuclease superfamily n=2 Tax=Bifidobacterium hapali TaxID=1630172 RepID=A0A261FUD6_9BIFI|nr:PD-(D/E)XK nuclease superfamily [Bifidobacterium hapali]
MVLFTLDDMTGTKPERSCYELHDDMRRDDAIVTLKDALASLLADSGALLACGAPGCGKTSFAFDVLMAGLRVEGGMSSVMTVSDRHTADLLADEAIRRIGSLSRTRPVTTLSAVAFQLVTTVRKRLGEPMPKLVNGAEQDALLHRVVEAHVTHDKAGDTCETCLLLRDYFGLDDWCSVLASENGDTREQRVSGDASRTVSGAFVVQLRDMIARMNELGVHDEDESSVLATLGEWSAHVERLRVQWRLAFALRKQYMDAIRQMPGNEFRLDSSRLLIEGVEAVRQANADELPRMVVVDDVQDLTLAGLSFLEALHEQKVPLVLVGNPDEAVQTFRGSYPEYVFAQIIHRFDARTLRIETVDRHPDNSQVNVSLDERDGEHSAYTYRELIASRVSLSIRSSADSDTPLPSRPGKLPQLPNSLPIRTLDNDNAILEDDSLLTRLYRSEAEELDDIVWHIKQAHLTQGDAWNDMAVIAHDNATVRAFGERLRRDGVPVRYSSVTRPLRDESFVQGLFALLELAQLRHNMPAEMPMSLSAIALFVRSRVSMLMSSPLISIGASRNHEGRPAILANVESAMNALESLASVIYNDANDLTDTDLHHNGASALRALIERWNQWHDAILQARAGVLVERDDSLIDEATSAGDNLLFGTNALYLLLEFDATDTVLASIEAICGDDPHAQAFSRLWTLVSKVAQGLESLPSNEPQYALALAWDACGVAHRWQREALYNTDEGRTANDRLDAAMRLFDYASGSTAAHDWHSFVNQIRDMRIEADSLARLAPIDQAVTLTTPAGAAGRHWKQVWIPALQQDVWPNLTPRNTMFGGEDLTNVVLFGRIFDGADTALDPAIDAVLASEQKSLLVALTRARRVTLSAVYDDDTAPSDFLYVYLPERFNRSAQADPQQRGYTPLADADRFNGLDGTVRGLVAAARTILVTQPQDSPQWADAIAALRLLRSRGVSAADPQQWPFVSDGQDEDNEHHTPALGDELRTCEAEQHTVDLTQGHTHYRNTGDTSSVVTLSPSDVDAIWACPICWMLSRRFYGPRASSVQASFGSLIHAVAQQASEEGLDLPNAFADQPIESRVAAIHARMLDIYHELSGPLSVSDPKQQYDAARKDASADAILDMIAHYFVMSNMDEYPAGNHTNFTVGTLQEAECERTFTARFDSNDILAACLATDGIESMSRSELIAIMGSLVGGWPEAMDEHLTIRLSGRMDRLERRILPNGCETVRLIDYKTGSVPSVKDIVNDLQLVCYQLALAFPEHEPNTGLASGHMPTIAQSALFHVAYNDAPAKSYGQESLFQPSLFTGQGLNNTVFMPRRGYNQPSKVLDVPDLPDTPPDGVRESTWQSLLNLRGTQAVWALTMIARVWYATAASQSRVLEAHPLPSHVRKCRMTTVCPACAGQIDTIFETRQA